LAKTNKNTKLSSNGMDELSGEDGMKLDEIYNLHHAENIAKDYKNILEEIGENPLREGLLKTPIRAAGSMQYLTQGYKLNPEAMLRKAIFKEKYNQMVIVKDIELYSLCEHHILPFFGKAHVAYIPDGRVVGLSKIPRVVDAFARRLQIQERMTDQIRDCIQNTLEPLGVAVVIEAQHLCMQMRGVQKQHSITTTSSFTGEFLKNEKTRQEFISLVRTLRH